MGMKGSKVESKPSKSNPQASHPPIDWSKWEAPGEGDLRSPCPMLNALANHHILPHDGKAITKEMAVNALTTSINLAPGIASLFATGALWTSPEKGATTFDLGHLAKHGVIEHDASLSRGDASLGDNHTFNKAIWDDVVKHYDGWTMTDFKSVSKARYDRMLAAKKAHEEARFGKDFQYGVKEFVLSYGESALFLGILGDPENGRIPVEYLRVLFEEERLPVKEGWMPNAEPLTQTQMNHLIFSLMSANEHKAEEAKEVGLGTAHEITEAVTEFLPSYCNIM